MSPLQGGGSWDAESSPRTTVAGLVPLQQRGHHQGLCLAPAAGLQARLSVPPPWKAVGLALGAGAGSRGSSGGHLRWPASGSVPDCPWSRLVDGFGEACLRAGQSPGEPQAPRTKVGLRATFLLLASGSQGWPACCQHLRVSLWEALQLPKAEGHTKGCVGASTSPSKTALSPAPFLSPPRTLLCPTGVDWGTPPPSLVPQ